MRGAEYRSRLQIVQQTIGAHKELLLCQSRREHRKGPALLKSSEQSEGPQPQTDPGTEPPGPYSREVHFNKQPTPASMGWAGKQTGEYQEDQFRAPSD
uniref:Uncharacterized protein n=1 Tax=Knipowitschia caucasica TaxID=637954 RepID=A0AAV2JNM4_KNICA